MLIDNWLIGAIDILPTVFTAYIFFFYFNIFFEKKKRGIRVLIGIVAGVMMAGISTVLTFLGF